MKISRPRATPWKNNQGFTREIAIEPVHSQFPKDKFIWRLSNAEVSGDNSFSQFPGYDRWLMVWKGDGLILNGTRLEPFTAFEFKGETPVNCELINGPVEDLGIIYQRGIMSPFVQLLHNEKTALTVTLKAGQHFLFCAQGSVELVDVNANLLEGESFSLTIDAPTQIQISSLLPAILIAITLA